MIVDILILSGTSVVVAFCAMATLALLWVCKQLWKQVFLEKKVAIRRPR